MMTNKTVLIIAVYWLNITVLDFSNNTCSIIIRITVQEAKFIPSGDDGGSKKDKKENQFDIIMFLSSPIGLIILGSCVGGVVLILRIIKPRIKSKSREKEIKKIEEAFKD